jgi:hypothetical protein
MNMHKEKIMKLSRLNRLTSTFALVMFMLISTLTLSVSPVLAANVQEEGEIYAGNVSEGIGFTHSGVNAKDNETVAFEIFYHNLEAPDSGLDALNVNIKADLPTTATTVHTVSTTIQAENSNQINDSTTVTTPDATTLQFVPGSVTWKHDVGTNAAPQYVTQSIPDGIVTNPNGEIVDQNEQPCNNFAGTVVFEAKIVPQPVQQTPAYACTDLGLTAEENRTVKISNFATTQSGGATYTNAVIDWGDHSTQTFASPEGQTHQYAVNGVYTVTATAHFTVAGTDKSASSVSCAQTVTFSSSTPPTVTPPAPVTPAAPTALVNTGPGSTLGLFAAASLGGAAFYRRLLARRLSRQ